MESKNELVDDRCKNGCDHFVMTPGLEVICVVCGNEVVKPSHECELHAFYSFEEGEPEIRCSVCGGEI